MMRSWLALLCVTLVFLEVGVGVSATQAVLGQTPPPKAMQTGVVGHWLGALKVPGALAQLTAVLGGVNSNIIEIAHERAFDASSARATVIEFILQLCGEEQDVEVRRVLADAGYLARMSAIREAGGKGAPSEPA